MRHHPVAILHTPRSERRTGGAYGAVMLACIAMFAASALVGCSTPPRATPNPPAMQIESVHLSPGHSWLLALKHAVISAPTTILKFEVPGQVQSLAPVGTRVKADDEVARADDPAVTRQLAETKRALEAAQSNLQASLPPARPTDGPTTAPAAPTATAGPPAPSTPVATGTPRADGVPRAGASDTLLAALARLCTALGAVNATVVGSLPCDVTDLPLSDATIASLSAFLRSQEGHAPPKLLSTASQELVVFVTINTRYAKAKAVVDAAALAYEKAATAADRLVLKAPATGVVAAVTGVVHGTTAEVSITIINGEGRDAELQFAVPETHYTKLFPGQVGAVSFQAAPQRLFPFRVASVAQLPTVTPAGAVSYRVIAQMEPAAKYSDDERTQLTKLGASFTEIVDLPSGMTASGTLIYATTNGILIPTSAISADRTVSLLKDRGQIIQTPVTVGLQDATDSQIVAGLEEGDSLILPSLAPTGSPTALPPTPVRAVPSPGTT